MTAQKKISAGTSLVDAAYREIRQRILDNVWPPGHRALEQEVAPVSYTHLTLPTNREV